MKSLTLLTLCALVALAACFAHADSDDHSSESHHSDSHDHDSHDDHDDHDHDHDHDHDGHDDHSGHGGHGSHGAANMKGMSIAVITACAWIVDILVILIPGLSEKKFLISILTAFGGGVFAITGVSHLLAEAVDIMNARYHDHDVERFRPAYLAAVLGYFIMLLLQRGIFKEASHGSGDMNKGFNEEQKTSSGSSSPTSEEKDEKENDGAVVPMGEETTQKKDEKKDTDGSPTTSGLIALAILFATLVIHRIVEGMALGLQESQEGVLVVFIAIIGHHWAMDLFFAFKTGRIPAEDGTAENPGSYFSTPVRIVLSFISSATTAIGIGIGWGLSSSIPSTAVAWLLAFSAGTFFFFGFSEVVVSEMPVGKRSLPQILAFFIGIAGMYGAVAGLYSEEAHNH